LQYRNASWQEPRGSAGKTWQGKNFCLADG
jgi:hypothetical protein